MTESSPVRPRQRSLGGRAIDRLAGIEDGSILRFAFFVLLAGTASVLYVDYTELMASAPFETPADFQPILPPFDPEGGNEGAQPAIVSDPDMLAAPLVIALGTAGELTLTGTIDPGSAERFAAEIAARGEYVQTISLDSPGGSVMDALAMGALIHEQGFATEVKSGALCASSCPLVFAGGVARIAWPDSAIGVHQVYAAAITGDPATLLQTAGLAMSEAQRTTATITRHLTETGVDPAMWLHALETPPNRLYYFSPEEMTGLNLVTELRQT